MARVILIRVVVFALIEQDAGRFHSELGFSNGVLKLWLDYWPRHTFWWNVSMAKVKAIFGAQLLFIVLSTIGGVKLFL